MISLDDNGSTFYFFAEKRHLGDLQSSHWLIMKSQFFNRSHFMSLHDFVFFFSFVANFELQQQYVALNALDEHALKIFCLLTVWFVELAAQTVRKTGYSAQISYVNFFNTFQFT